MHYNSSPLPFLNLYCSLYTVYTPFSRFKTTKWPICSSFFSALTGLVFEKTFSPELSYRKVSLFNFATLLTFELDVLQETSSLLFTKLTCHFSHLVKTWKCACLFIRSAFFSLVILPITNVNPNPNPNVCLTCAVRLSNFKLSGRKTRKCIHCFQFRPRLQLVPEISGKLILGNINATVRIKQTLVYINLHVWLVRSVTDFLFLHFFLILFFFNGTSKFQVETSINDCHVSG